MIFLHVLSHKGLQAGWFVPMPLGKLDKNCCPQAQTEVIDFDQTTMQVAKMLKKPTPKSCDALKIFCNDQRLDFIEMKGWRAFIQRNPASAIPQQIKKFNLSKKISDSLGVLRDLITLMALGDVAHQHYRETHIHYVVLIDIQLERNPLEHLALSLGFLSESSTPIRQQIIQGLSKELDKLPEQLKKVLDLMPNLHQPRLQSCEGIDAYYRKTVDGEKTL